MENSVTVFISAVIQVPIDELPEKFEDQDLIDWIDDNININDVGYDIDGYDYPEGYGLDDEDSLETYDNDEL